MKSPANALEPLVLSGCRVFVEHARRFGGQKLHAAINVMQPAVPQTIFRLLSEEKLKT
jgi:hypothetical protein